MNQLTNPEYLKDLFRHYQIKPKDVLGQNFLIDEIVLDEIIGAADLKKTDTVLEVGPGLGILTQQLATHAGKVISVEKDDNMMEILKINLKDYPNVKVVHQDILQYHVSEQIKGKYKVVANIPYYLTSHLFQYFLKQKNKPESMVFMIQKEVGERVTAEPGDMSVLAISVQAFADAMIMAQVPKECFWPIPKVNSVIIKIEPKLKYKAITDEKEFFKIVKVAFAAKRKQLHNNLSNGLGLSHDQVMDWLKINNIEPTSRAEDLSIEDWVKLYITKTPQ